jgi:hypothetical protein
MPEELDYERDVEIDVDALDIEWLDQPRLAMKYGRHVSQLRKKVAQLEEKKKTERSELIKEANEDPQGCCGKDKPNAADIEAYYRSSTAYQKAVDELLDAQYELSIAEIAYNEISWTRRMALENLVKLYGQQYFAGPRVPRDISKEWENKKKQQQSDSTVGSGMRRRKRE